MSGKQDDQDASMNQDDAAAVRREIAELRAAVRNQGAMIAWLKEDNERQERNHNSLSAHVQDEFARAFLWLDAIACKVLPGAVTLANELAEKFAGSPGGSIPPHRLGRCGKDRPTRRTAD